MIHSRQILRLFSSAVLLAAMILPGLAQQTTGVANPAQDPRGLVVRQQPAGVAPDGRGKLWAVVVGISSYKNIPPEGQLRFAHRDAEDFAAFLRTPGGGGFPANHVKLLLNQAATLSAIRTAIGTWLVRSVEPDDVVYLFFAGHGVVEGERDGYLLAHDSDPQNLYATALQVGELDRIITERLHARIVVLMADACHAGQLGWTSRGAPEMAAINLYLDEVGKSGAGVVRLLASRANERSFEDPRWGGGHGAFTHFLLEGLKGKADRDKDRFVRVNELVGYLSEVVPEETLAKQHPRMAGSIDPRLPLAVLAAERAATPVTNPGPSTSTSSLELRGVPGSDVYVDNTLRGKIRPNGLLIIQDLSPERHEVSVDAPNSESLTQTVLLIAGNNVLELKPAGRVPTSAKASPPVREPSSPKTSPPVREPSSSKPPTPVLEPSSPRISPLIEQINQAMERRVLFEPGGAWPLYKQLINESPNEPQRRSIEIGISTALEEIGQQAINSYVSSSVVQLRASEFRRGAQAFKCLRSLNPSDSQLEAKQLFCEARVATDEVRNNDAITALNRAISLDPKAGYLYNALGVAYEKEKDDDKAHDAFKRAAELAPQWSFPRLHLAIQLQNRGKMERAEEEFEAAVRLDPRDAFNRWMLVRQYRERGKLAEAERAAFDLIRMSPAFASVHVELGMIYEAARQYGRAADSYETFLRLAPTAPDARFTGYDVAKIRDAALRNRQQGGKKEPRLKKH
ncbi:MAG: tetratricopeptide repeat protein [Acidobacteriota bacterium]